MKLEQFSSVFPNGVSYSLYQNRQYRFVTFIFLALLIMDKMRTIIYLLLYGHLTKAGTKAVRECQIGQYLLLLIASRIFSDIVAKE